MAKKESQLIPTLQEIFDRGAEAGVGLNRFLLLLHPNFEAFHDRTTFPLMVKKSGFLIHPLVSTLLVIVIDFSKLCNHMPAFLGEVRKDIDKLAPSVDDASRHQ